MYCEVLCASISSETVLCRPRELSRWEGVCGGRFSAVLYARRSRASNDCVCVLVSVMYGRW